MLETNRISLRPWVVEDAGALFKYASDQRVSEMALWPRHTSIDMSREVIESFFIPNPYCFAMILKSTSEPIGCIGLIPEEAEHFKPQDNEREVGYWIGFPHWNKGLTTEALKTLISFCKNDLKLSSLLITTDINNRASQRVAEKSGFKFIQEFDLNDSVNLAFRLTL